MSRDPSIGELWDSAPSSDRVFEPAELAHLPEAAQRYLGHAIAPGTKLARAVRCRMHGEIKLHRWLQFKAEQVIVWDRGFIWKAKVSMPGMPISGSDRLVDGQGSMRWKLYGLIPVLSGSGPDITRSAAGRVAGEAVWIPSVLCSDNVSWPASGQSWLQARFAAHEETSELEFQIDEAGRLKTAKLQRWGDPGSGAFRYVDFGVMAQEETTFGGYTIPSQFRAGWHFGTEQFESEGEFFRATIDYAEYR
jgi:hypothetical protein